MGWTDGRLDRWRASGSRTARSGRTQSSHPEPFRHTCHLIYVPLGHRQPRWRPRAAALEKSARLQAAMSCPFGGGSSAPAGPQPLQQVGETGARAAGLWRWPPPPPLGRRSFVAATTLCPSCPKHSHGRRAVQYSRRKLLVPRSTRRPTVTKARRPSSCPSGESVCASCMSRC